MSHFHRSIMWGFGATLLLTLSSSPVSAQGKWVAPPSAASVKNPVQKSDKVFSQAKKIFEQTCQSCHGPKGLGDGPGAATLPAKPANWTSPEVQKQTDGEIFWKISEGRLPMPPWKNILSESDRWAMVHFIRTLKK